MIVDKSRGRKMLTADKMNNDGCRRKKKNNDVMGGEYTVDTRE